MMKKPENIVEKDKKSWMDWLPSWKEMDWAEKAEKETKWVEKAKNEVNCRAKELQNNWEKCYYEIEWVEDDMKKKKKTGQHREKEKNNARVSL